MIAKPLKALAATRASRRSFLSGAAAAGALVVGTTIGRAQDKDTKDKALVDAQPDLSKVPAQPNAFVRIAPDNTVTVIVKHLDMGQGNTTGLATLVADELDADWSQMRTDFAPADAKVYNNLLWGPAQGTGGSTAIANSWMQLRKAGAAAREMLVAAAAYDWKAPAQEIRVDKGVVRHPGTNRSATFGELAERAAVFPVPQEPRLKQPKDWVYIGKRIPRIDSAAKTTGATVYSLDVRRPGMLTAVVAHPPQFGGAVRSFDAAAARQVAGVVEVVQIPSGIAVIARDTWSALKGREALKVEWDETQAERRSTEAIMAEYKRLADGRGLLAADKGDARRAIGAAAKVLEAEFEFPYLAHAAMEPMNATIARNPAGTVEVWAGCQIQTVEQAAIAAILDVAPEKVNLHTVWAGGSFGRRATPNADYLAEAAQILKASTTNAPIHLVWMREDDMRGGYYRPMVYHRVRAGLDRDGNIVGWDHAIVGKSILIGSPFEAMMVKDGVDATTVEGVADTAYAIPNLRTEVHNAKDVTPVLWWRSVGHTHTAQAMEVFIDELAHAAGKDPVQYRLALLKDAPRDAAVLRLAAEKAGWGETMPKGRGRGVAVHESFGSHVAMVADVIVDGGLKVDRVVAAVDCGIPVNPDVIAAQVEGAVGFALSSVLRNKITLKNGVVQETNYDSFEPTRMSEMPKVEVHIVPSTENPTGIGEPGVPNLAPAVSNAVFAATGKRLRSLPLDLGALRGV